MQSVQKQQPLKAFKSIRSSRAFYRVELTYDYLTINGVGSLACFFNRLAAFFSFGVIKACFFPSLLDRWDLDMMFLLVRIKALSERREAEAERLRQTAPINPQYRGYGS